MAFTVAELAAQIDKMKIATWANSTPVDQKKFIPGFRVAFAALQAWIIEHGGEEDFGWDHVLGLILEDGTPVVLKGPQETAPFNDAFNDVRKFLDSPTFSLSQAAVALSRLSKYLKAMK